MKKTFIYSSWIILITIFSQSCGSNLVKLPPLIETFSHKDKNPFGAFVLHHQLEQLYFHNAIRKVNHNFENTFDDIADTGSLYISVSKNLYLTKADLAGILDYVYAGNSLFISSDNIDKRLLDTLGCKVKKVFYERPIPEMKYTSVKLQRQVFNDPAVYQYFYFPFYNHFTKLDSLHSRVLGSNSMGANFIVIFYGDGRVYLHIEPRALSNYFLLQKDNYKYFQHVFSFTPAIPERVYWDDYYKKRDDPGYEGGNKSSLGVLLRYPPMAWAFWLLLILFGLYVYFGGKRRQRIVATIPPNNNTTTAFAETIGRLYLQQKDNRNIADKLITYFMEHIRNQYYLNTSHLNEEFINTLSRKSNNTREGMEKLFKSIGMVQQSMEIGDQQLLSLNQQIENFYKNKI
ncbi:MAG: hypothetical protein H7Z13_07930 [Ferruginibacter sp.]|nr:hypothetical protein [Ferruginibacter sp.]